MARNFLSRTSMGLGLEEEVLAADGASDDLGTAEALANVTAEGEVAEAEAEAAEHEATTDGLMEGAVALEQMRLTIAAANENGGLDRFGAMMAKQHADFIILKCHNSAKGMPMPSMESFGGTNGRISSGVLTMESIGSKLNEFWQAILRMLKKTREKLEEWFNKIFGNAEKIIKRADAIIKRIDGLSVSTAKEKKFDNPTIFNGLAMDNALDTGKVKGGIANAAKLAEAMVATSPELNKAVEDLIEDADKKDATFDVDTAVDELIAKAALPGIAANTPIPGNVTVRLAVKSTPPGNTVPHVVGYGLPAIANAKPNDTGTCSTLSLDDCRGFANAAKSIGQALQAARKAGDASKKTFDKAEKFCTKAAAEEKTKKVDAVQGSAGAPASGAGPAVPAVTAVAGVKEGSNKDVMAVIRMAMPMIDGPIKAFGGRVLQVARLTLDYCDASIALYKS